MNRKYSQDIHLETFHPMLPEAPHDKVIWLDGLFFVQYSQATPTTASMAEVLRLCWPLNSIPCLSSFTQSTWFQAEYFLVMNKYNIIIWDKLT